MTYNPQSRSALANILAAQARLGDPLPQAMADELAALDDAQAAAAELDTYNPQTLARVTLDALRAGRDPLEDDDVRRALFAHTVQDAHLATLVAREADSARVAVLEKHAAELVAGWAAAVDKAQTALAAARSRYPDADPTDPNSVRGMRPEDMGKWGRAHEAVAVVETIESMLVSLLAMRRAIDHRYRPLLVADLTADDLDALQAQVMRPAAADVIRAGHPLSLATPAEFAARCARVADARQRESARRESAAQDAWAASMRING